ncbi:MAG: Gfo/Idh/MocA family oxidoreductase [Hyphomonadaceae bacterium]
MTAKRLRLGMVGGGEGAFIGAVHRMAARLDDRWTLVAGAFQSDPERSVAFGRTLGLENERCYASFDEMAEREAARADRIDAVSIVTPNHLHAPAASAFLRTGIPVICDKPLGVSTAEVRALERLVSDTGLPFIVTHNYSGYPMIREARAMIASGELGDIRLVQVEYAQDWLATDLSGNKQADWRGDPARAGPGGALGDIATHAFHLAEFTTGTAVSSLAADLSTFVPNRRVDDNANILLRFENGAKGSLWASQVAVGAANALRLRVYGEKAGLEWMQETPDALLLTPLSEPPRLMRRGGPSLSAAALHASRIPAGHPEGYLEGFAQIYSDAAELVRAHNERRPPDPLAAVCPNIRDGVRGVTFIEATIASNRNNGAWTPIDGEPV